MTVGEWLASRTPSAPAALTARLEAVVAPHADRDASDAARVCIDGAQQLLTTVLAEPASREQAYDLLAADALVTYAFEAAAENPDSVAELALWAMRRFAACAVADDAAALDR